MDKCVIDTSTSDLILMIGGQILFLGLVLFIIFFGKLPMTFPIASLTSIVGSNSMTSSASALQEAQKKVK
jgi:hypothetical protein